MSEEDKKDIENWTPPMPTIVEHWGIVDFEDIVENVSTNGITIPQKSYLYDGEYPIVDQGQALIGGYTNDKNKVLLNIGNTIIFGDHTRCFKLINFEFAPGADGVKVLKPSNGVDFKFIFYALRNTKLPNRGYSRHYSFLKKSKLALPPINEQKRIVAKIEELFSGLDKGVKNLKTASEQLNVYRETVLKNAFERYFIAKEQPLEFKKIGDICKSIVPNRDKPKSFSGSIPWVTTPNLSTKQIKINYSDISKGLSKDEIAMYKAKIIPIDSVIMTCVGNFGVIAIVEKELVINQQLHAFLPSAKFMPKYLAYALKSKKNYMYELSTSVTVSYLNKSNCNTIPIPLMSLEEQQKIVAKIESRFSVIDKIEQEIETNLQKLEVLRQSILKKAFSGQLVKQDPTDEPASILLDRIKSEKKARQFKSLL